MFDTMKPISDVYNMDCLEYMRTIPDKTFDLCIADPPYGIGAGKMTMGNGKKKKWKKKDWDSSIPKEAVFDEILRTCKNVVIWGGNYFDLPKTKSWIVWDKGIDGDTSFADGELAWTNFNAVLRIAHIRYKGFIGADKNRIHPTQKPIALYHWVLKNYAKNGDKIFDPFLGSGSSRIAAYKLGFDFVGCEIDEEYFRLSEERFKKECNGVQTLQNGVTITQGSLF